jgi:signal transduction histidine kinase
MTVGIGVIGMRERVIALGGALNIRSDQNHGTHLSASIPIFDQTNNANAA